MLVGGVLEISTPRKIVKLKVCIDLAQHYACEARTICPASAGDGYKTSAQTETVILYLVQGSNSYLESTVRTWKQRDELLLSLQQQYRQYIPGVVRVCLLTVVAQYD